MDSGPSRGSWASSLQVVGDVLGSADTDARALAGELFALSELLSNSTKLRRALSDPSRDAWPKRELAQRVFAGRVSPQAMRVLEATVSGRWSHDRDLVDALERLGWDAIFSVAEREGNLDQIEEELFHWERVVSADQNLREALRQADAPLETRLALVQQLLGSRALPDTVWLAQRPIHNPRGRRYVATLWRQLKLAAQRRHQITAIVTSAIELDDAQKDRISAALSKIYGRSVFVTTIVDPVIVGGLHIRVGDEVVDGTVIRRLEDARRGLVG